MLIIKLNKKNKQQVLALAVLALRAGKTVVYPTDTTYGLGAFATNSSALRKIYKIKERQASKPVHVLVPSIAYAKKILEWNPLAEKLARKFLPGPLSIALPLRKNRSAFKTGRKNKANDALLKKLTAGSGYLGIRIPKNGFAIELARNLGQPITATSANPSAHLSGGFDPYSAEDVIRQFRGKKYQPDILIDAGFLPHRKPSTFVKIQGDSLEILREGPISKAKILKI